MTITIPALSVAFAAFCVWMTVRIVNRQERWAKWSAVSMILICVYGVAYAAMMQPCLLFWRPGDGFGATQIAKPEYRWWKDCGQASPQWAWKLAFAPAFAVHLRIDPDWAFYKRSRSGFSGAVSDAECFQLIDAGTAFLTDEFGRNCFANLHQKPWNRR